MKLSTLRRTLPPYGAVIGLILGLPVMALAADVSFYGVFKGQALEQAAAGAPTLKGKPFRFQALVIPAGPGLVTGASSQGLPNGTFNTLTPEDDTFGLGDKLTTRAALDTTYPNGSYRVVINTVH